MMRTSCMVSTAIVLEMLFRGASESRFLWLSLNGFEQSWSLPKSSDSVTVPGSSGFFLQKKRVMA